MSLDRLQGNEIRMTHELLANMLGVRREGVTENALKLQEQWLIRCRRGHVVVLDRKGREGAVCDCYAVLRRENDRRPPDKMAIL